MAWIALLLVPPGCALALGWAARGRWLAVLAVPLFVAADGLPQMQIARLGGASCDFADFFAAALVGAILARRGGRQLLAAVATFVVTQAFDQLFRVTDTLPATVPPAVVLVALGAVRPFRPAPAADPGRR